ncbi:MAG: hydantoinase/oxoprolinase family protein [Pseudomonadota bacterium]|jgi:N-methylhydantoinase A|nr:hydantoinase/oxoprolinase family protein [Pseudomonadota bacterium]
MTQDRYRVAVDVGGTFMDFVLMDEATGAARVEKIPSIPDRLHEQFLKGIESLDVDIDSIQQIFHGMTVGVNALVQEKGAKVGLLTTKGFRDVLEMGRGGRKPVYNFLHQSAPPLVERFLRLEIPERMTFDGEVLTPIDLEAVDTQVDLLLARGAEAIAICFLHAYAQPAHEIAARQRILARHPHLPISVSHEIASEWREYERTSTTVLNAFIQPTVQTYLTNLETKLKDANYTRSLAIMQSSGGVVDAKTAGRKPIRTLMSGPAGGVIGAKFLCDRLGYANVICTDVGGTTYDVAIIEEGRVLERSQAEIAQRPILGSLIDVISIGAGGGSIAWLDHRGGLQVGPQSAGASPGPVCFGRGGTEPTVTDAHLTLGRLDPAYFLGGRMQLDTEGARAAIEKKIAAPLGLDLQSAAQGIVSIAETNMANAIRSKTVERGLDPREFVLLAYGGGGGLFACSVAEELEVPKVIVPNAPANFSAWGILTTDYMEDEVRTKVMPFDAAHIAGALATMNELETRAANGIGQYGFAAGDIERVKRFDLRFENQEYTITIDLEDAWRDAASILEGARQRFVESHIRLYGHGEPDAPLELVSIRCRAIGRVRAPEIAPMPERPQGAAMRQLNVYFPRTGKAVPTDVFDRETLSAGQIVTGPAIINEWTMTTIVPPGWQSTCDTFGNLVLEPTL